MVVGVDGRPEGLDALALAERLASVWTTRSSSSWSAYPYAPLSSRDPRRTDRRGERGARPRRGQAGARQAGGGADHRSRVEPGPHAARGGRDARRSGDRRRLLEPRAHGQAGARRGDGGDAAARALRGRRGAARLGRTAPARFADRGGGRRVRPRQHRRRARGVGWRSASDPRAVRRSMWRPAPPARGGPAQVEASVRLEGEPADALAAHSAELDLLVLGSRGRGRLGSVVLGSVAARLIGIARCPVLALPSRAPVDRRFAVAGDLVRMDERADARRP